MIEGLFLATKITRISTNDDRDIKKPSANFGVIDFWIELLGRERALFSSRKNARLQIDPSSTAFVSKSREICLTFNPIAHIRISESVDKAIEIRNAFRFDSRLVDFPRDVESDCHPTNSAAKAGRKPNA